MPRFDSSSLLRLASYLDIRAQLSSYVPARPSALHSQDPLRRAEGRRRDVMNSRRAFLFLILYILPSLAAAASIKNVGAACTSHDECITGYCKCPHTVVVTVSAASLVRKEDSDLGAGNRGLGLGHTCSLATRSAREFACT